MKMKELLLFLSYVLWGSADGEFLSLNWQTVSCLLIRISAFNCINVFQLYIQTSMSLAVHTFMEGSCLDWIVKNFGTQTLRNRWMFILSHLLFNPSASEMELIISLWLIYMAADSSCSLVRRLWRTSLHDVVNTYRHTQTDNNIQSTLIN